MTDSNDIVIVIPEEKQVAEEAGVQKVYGCGSNIYILKLQ